MADKNTACIDHSNNETNNNNKKTTLKMWSVRAISVVKVPKMGSIMLEPQNGGRGHAQN